jgi:rubrerythrin
MPAAKTTTTVTTPVPGRASGEFLSAPSSSQRPDAERSLDDWDPDEDLVAPISIRTSVATLLWVCGDCREHYPRAQSCPEKCDACGAPREHFYSPIED